MNKTQVFFDHIPKTAGTSITEALTSIMGNMKPLLPCNHSHFNVIKNVAGAENIAGHFWFMPNEQLVPNFYYCTLLRDPVERFVSQYYFGKQRGQSMIDSNLLSDPCLRDPQVISALQLSLDDYLCSSDPSLTRSYTNIQAVHFALRKCNNDPWDLSEKDLLDAAISSLEEYDLVRTFDQLQEFIDCVAVKFGRTSVQIPLRNVTPNKPQASQSALQKLNDANRVDAQLVAWVKQRIKSTPRCEKSTLVENDISAVEEMETPAKSTEPFNFGSKTIEIISAECIAQSSGNQICHCGEEINIRLVCDAKVMEEDLTVGIAIRDQSGNLVYGTNSNLLDKHIAIAKLGKFEIKFKFKVTLGLGHYSVTAALHKRASHLDGCYHWIEHACGFDVIGNFSSPFEGVVNLDARITG